MAPLWLPLGSRFAVDEEVPATSWSDGHGDLHTVLREQHENQLGDAVMSLRAVRAFKHGRPDARLAVLTPAKLGAFWKSIPEVDEVVSFAPVDSVLSIAKRIRGRFDAAMLFSNSFRSASSAPFSFL